MKTICLVIALALCAVAQEKPAPAPLAKTALWTLPVVDGSTEFSQEKPAPAPAAKSVEVPLAKETALELQLVATREKAAQELLQKLVDLVMGPYQQQRNALISAACKSAGIDLKACVVDPDKMIVRREEPAPAAPPAK